MLVHHSAHEDKPDTHTHTDRSVRTGGRGVSVLFLDVDAWKLGLVTDCLRIPKFFRSGGCRMLEVRRVAHPHRSH